MRGKSGTDGLAQAGKRRLKGGSVSLIHVNI